MVARVNLDRGGDQRIDIFPGSETGTGYRCGAVPDSGPGNRTQQPPPCPGGCGHTRHASATPPPG